MDNHQAIIKKINEFGSSRTPFFLVVDFEMENPQLIRLEDLKLHGIECEFPTFKTQHANELYEPITLDKHVLPFDAYKQKFDIVQYHLHYGNSFLTNLTCETPIQTETSLGQIYHQAKAKYKINFNNEWICFSPETFVRIKNGIIFSHPMKGTIDASIPNAAQILLNDEKEIAEHYTIVDLIRNDLSIVSSNVEVKRFRYVETLKTSNKTLLQVSSEIQGKLPENYLQQLGTILFALLPAGSISGAPKHKTLEIIREAETIPRGFYTGTAFYFDGEEVDSCVLIRFIEQKSNETKVYKSGGGITVHSIAENEYQELSDKIYVPGI